MPKTKTTPKALEEVRERIRALQAERAAAERAPRSREEVARAVRAGLRALAEGAKVNAHELVSPRGGSLHLFDADYAAIAGHAAPSNAARASAQMVTDFSRQVAGVLAAMQPETVEAWVMARVDAELSRLPAPLGVEERRTKLAELDRELRRAELEEERIAEALEAEGREVLRRADASPEVVLGLAEEAA